MYNLWKNIIGKYLPSNAYRWMQFSQPFSIFISPPDSIFYRTSYRKCRFCQQHHSRFISTESRGTVDYKIMQRLNLLSDEYETKKLNTLKNCTRLSRHLINQTCSESYHSLYKKRLYSTVAKSHAVGEGNKLSKLVPCIESLGKLLSEWKEKTDLAYKSNSFEHVEEISQALQKLQPLHSVVTEYNNKQQELLDYDEMISEMMEDVEMKQALEDEKTECEENMQELLEQFSEMILPPEVADDKDVILECTAGVGGREAMLFTYDIMTMYQNFAEYKGWDVNIIESDITTDAGVNGLRKGSAVISGQDVYKSLKYESGVHRVQRIPHTEKGSRVHTSTMTVAVLPQPSEIDIKINEGDLQYQTFRSGGAGGQHVNKTDSAVRLIHKTSGMVVECQVHRSQIKNREMALNILKSRLYQIEVDAQQEAINKTRKLQIGTGMRSERIRTYNFLQDRITDHRIGVTLHQLDSFLTNGESLDELISSLQEASNEERLDILIKEIVENPEQFCHKLSNPSL